MLNGSNADEIFANISNNNNNNASCCPDGNAPSLPVSSVFAFRFSLPFAIICCLNIGMAFASLFVNSLLLWALARVENSALKAKRFIINLSVTNMCLPLAFALDPYFITSLIHMKDNMISPNICALGVSATAGLILFCAQPVCVLGLACDRIYAVARPLTYSTTGYTQLMRRLTVIAPWFFAMIVWVSFLLISWPSLPPSEIPGIPTFCLHMLSTYMAVEGIKLLDSLMAGINLFSFFAYICIFVIIKYRERSIGNLSMTSAKKTTLSLARTYFLTNITTLALYLPAPMFSIITENATGYTITEQSAYIASSLMILHVGNTCLDPLILMSRIPSIRRHLPIVSKFSVGRRDRNQTNRATVSQKTEVKTVSTLSA